jgi:hypothetical protein
MPEKALLLASELDQKGENHEPAGLSLLHEY